MGKFKDNALTRVFRRKDARRAEGSTGALSVAEHTRDRAAKADKELNTARGVPMTIDEWRRRETQASVARTVPKIEVSSLQVPSDLNMHSSFKKPDALACAGSSVTGRRDNNASPQDAFVTHAPNSRQYSAVSLRSGCAPEMRGNSTYRGARRYTENTERVLTVAREPRAWSRYSQVSENCSCPVTEGQHGMVSKASMTAEANQRHRAEDPTTMCCCHGPNPSRPNANGKTCGCSAPYTAQPEKPALCRAQHSCRKKCRCSPTTAAPSGYVETMTYTYPCFDPNCQASSCAHMVSESCPKLDAGQMSSIVAGQPASCLGGTVCIHSTSPAHATSVSTACAPAVHAPAHGTTTTTTTTQTSTTTLTYQTITYPDGRSVTRLLPRDETVSQGPAMMLQTQANQSGCADQWPVSAGNTVLLRQQTGPPAILQSQSLTPPMPIMAAPAVGSGLELVRNVGGFRGARAVPVVIPLNTAYSDTSYFGFGKSAGSLHPRPFGHSACAMPHHISSLSALEPNRIQRKEEEYLEQLVFSDTSDTESEREDVKIEPDEPTLSCDSRQKRKKRSRAELHAIPVCKTDSKDATSSDNETVDEDKAYNEPESDIKKSGRVCVWHDSDDEAADTVVDLPANPKLRKLLPSARKDTAASVLTAGSFHEKLQAYRTRVTQADGWAASLRGRATVEHSNEAWTGSESESDVDMHESDGLKKEEEEEAVSGAAAFSGLDQLSKNNRNAIKENRYRGSRFAQSTAKILASDPSGVSHGARGPLRPGPLKYRILSDINRSEPSECAVVACGFVLGRQESVFAAGRDKTIRIFDICSSEYKRVAAFHIQKREIRSSVPIYLDAAQQQSGILFTAGTRGVGIIDVASGTVDMCRSVAAARRHQEFYRVAPGPPQCFALTADHGHVLCCDLRTRSVVHDFKMSAAGQALSFLPGHDVRDSHLYTGDANGRVYDWDLRAGRCAQAFSNEGAESITSIATGGSTLSALYLAVGSKSGYVSIYDMNRHGHSGCSDGQPLKADNLGQATSSLSFYDALEVGVAPRSDVTLRQHSLQKTSLQSPVFKPVKSLGHLTTAVSDLQFHPSGELLAMTSSRTREGVKLVHLPSFTVFSNFPRQDKSLNLKYPESIAFNPLGSLMVIGNSHGLLKRIEMSHFVSRKRRGANNPINS